MTGTKHILTDSSGKQITVWVQQDKRLSKTSRWGWQPDGAILLRVPFRLPKKMVAQHLDQIAVQLEKQEKMAERRTDAELQQRAEYINQKYFGGKIEWRAIRWVSNMNHRLGSCTHGGPTDGHIRISDKIRGWPQWVIDAVIAHELVHRLHPQHSPEFWAALNAGYPLTERARGFIQGMGFAEGQSYEDD